jgi:uncharacterized damage-inducible protein DinB
MSNREFYQQRWEPEQPAFVRVLRALPPEKLDYRPHERSTSAGDLAWQLTEELRTLSDLIDTGAINWVTTTRPATLDEIVAAYEENLSQLRTRLAATDDEKWESKGRFLFDGNEVFATTVGDLFWGMLFDAVHHRGQLSAYIRPMGGKVPSIYGPSADDSGGM